MLELNYRDVQNLNSEQRYKQCSLYNERLSSAISIINNLGDGFKFLTFQGFNFKIVEAVRDHQSITSAGPHIH
jgi:hypothetical protein